jgi:hypothetical protein
MPFPRDRVELCEAGYRYESKARCSICHARIEFWRTPKNRLIPITADELTNRIEPHFARCLRTSLPRLPRRI